jgi:hypothetical protein
MALRKWSAMILAALLVLGAPVGGIWYCLDGKVCSTCATAGTQAHSESNETDADCAGESQDHCEDCCRYTAFDTALVAARTYQSHSLWLESPPALIDYVTFEQPLVEMEVTPPSHAPPRTQKFFSRIHSPRAPPIYC